MSQNEPNTRKCLSASIIRFISDIGTAEVVIYIEDVNDNDPKLKAGQENHEIFENFSFESVRKVTSSNSDLDFSY